MNLNDLGVKPVKMITGSRGIYYQTAGGPKGEFYMKLQFEPGNVIVNDLMVQVDVLQVNILYVGEKFDIPAPWEHLEQRPYVIEGKPVAGHLLGKFWMPMGEFQKSIKAMSDHCRDVLAPIIDKAVEGLYGAAEAGPVIDMAGLFDLLAEGLDKDKMVCEPKMYVNQQWKENQKSLSYKMKSKYDQDPNPTGLGDDPTDD